MYNGPVDANMIKQNSALDQTEKMNKYWNHYL